MKDTVEKEALLYLQEFDKERYENAELSDKPDIKNRLLSVGVEVTVVEFEEIILNTKIVGKNLIEYFKMTAAPFIEKSKLKHYKKISEDHDMFKEFLLEKPVYANEAKEAIFIDSKWHFDVLPDTTKIYFPSNLILYTLEDGIIAYPPATAQWVGMLPERMLKSLKQKEEKIVGYENFKELNLYIKCFSGDNEEINKFEELVRKYNSNNPSEFDIVYVTDYWGDKGIHEIVL